MSWLWVGEQGQGEFVEGEASSMEGLVRCEIDLRGVETHYCGRSGLLTSITLTLIFHRQGL